MNHFIVLIKRFFSSPINYILYLLNRINAFNWIRNEKIFIKLKYRAFTGSSLNLNNPQTFSEKLQWLKIYDRNPRYTDLVDKYKVKAIVAEQIGSEYIIPTLGVWDNPEDIEWNTLPNQFVLKTTHGGGGRGIIICRDKSSFDTGAAINHLKQSMKQDIYKEFREWPYKGVPHRIIAEKYINPDSNDKDLPDYKWYCFNGNPLYCQIIQDRSTEESIDFFDPSWNHQEFVGLNPLALPAKVLPSRPSNLETQLMIARKLSKGIPFSRIDLYEVKASIYFGEVTFYPASGLGVFRPKQYNDILGRLIVLPGDNLLRKDS